MATKRPRPPTGGDVLVQVATRVPASLLHRVKVHCIEREQTVMTFFTEAVREKLRRERES